MNQGRPDDPHRQDPRDPRASWNGAKCQELANRGSAANAHRITSTPRSPNGPRSWWSTAASAKRHATGKASTKSSTTLRRLEDDQTLLMQSGKPVGVFRTHADAPRVLIANSNLVPAWATWDHFHELDRKGLMMYGQMTAGSWIYIGTQGIVQGTYETFVEAGSAALRRRFRRAMDTDRGSRRHGRRAAVGGGDGRRLMPGRGMPALPHRDAAEDRLSGPAIEQPG